MFNKKAIVSLNTFVLLLIVYLLIFTTSYWFYSDSKLDSELKFNQMECLNSALNFRSEVISILNYPNSTSNYINLDEMDNINISINNNIITSSQIIKNKLSSTNISSLGINFCSNYSFIESQDISINYNGSCVSLNLS